MGPAWDSSAEIPYPLVLRIIGFKAASQPRAAINVQQRRHAIEVGLVPRSRCRCFIKKLYFRRQIRKACRIVTNDRGEWAGDLGVALKEPLALIGMIEHQFQHPEIRTRWPAPERIHLRPRCCSPWEQFPLAPMCLEELPRGQMLEKQRNILSEYPDVQITMRSGLVSDKDIQRPSPGNPPWHIQI